MRKISILAVAILAALGAGALAVSMSSGSSHSEAPGTQLDAAADNTDLYAFTPKDNTKSVALVGNWFPLRDPASGPNFQRFDPRAAYYFNIDNTGDGRYDIRYRFKFRTKIVNPNSFLYALPGVSSLTDPKLNTKEFYSITREEYSRGRLVRQRRIASNLQCAPANVGPKTFPNYAAVAQQAIRNLPGGGKVFCGPIEDPFYVDLGATFDALTIRNGTGNAGGGKDDVAGYNVLNITMQLPEQAVTRDGRQVSSAKADNAVIGVCASTNRPRVQVTSARTFETASSRGRIRDAGPRGEVQVSRLCNPLVNEVGIPLGDKDKFNASYPQDDAKNFGKYILNPELARLLNILYPGLNVPEKNRTDLLQVFTGLPGLNKISPNAVPADTLKLNLGIDPSAKPSRFGVIGGDNAGFPNGRRLIDDPVDILERVYGGFLLGNKLPLGDGVDQNDKPFSDSFPYVVGPNAGPDSQLKRLEPPHAPVPGDPTGF